MDRGCNPIASCCSFRCIPILSWQPRVWWLRRTDFHRTRTRVPCSLITRSITSSH